MFKAFTDPHHHHQQHYHHHVIKAGRHKDLFEFLAWTFAETNDMFHILYHEGTWLDRSTALTVLDHGWSLCEALDNFKSLRNFPSPHVLKKFFNQWTIYLYFLI